MVKKALGYFQSFSALVTDFCARAHAHLEILPFALAIFQAYERALIWKCKIHVILQKCLLYVYLECITSKGQSFPIINRLTSLGENFQKKILKRGKNCLLFYYMTSAKKDCKFTLMLICFCVRSRSRSWPVKLIALVPRERAVISDLGFSKPWSSLKEILKCSSTKVPKRGI